MANSPNYTATKEDARPWRSAHDTLANANDEASQANADALEAAARASNPVTAISIQATMNLDLSDVETEQVVITTDPVGNEVQCTYVSSDPTKATVSASGLVTPVAIGTTTITATCVHNPAVSDTCAVTVVA